MNQEQFPAGQRSGNDPKFTAKRNSGLFAFFKWFKPSTSRESIDTDSRTSSLDSLDSNKSAGTVASFSFVPPGAYEKRVVVEKCIQVGPETDTYKARLRQRDRRREYDKNVTLRKKYNLFFNRDSLLKPQQLTEEENSRSLPLMTRAEQMEVEQPKVHRRTNSESSKVRKAGAYLHVKGKRRAPQPPVGKQSMDVSSTASLKRKKRLAPARPDQDVLCNDSLKLEDGVLRSAKDDGKNATETNQGMNPLSPSSSRTSFVDTPVSPRPWYKRNSTVSQQTSGKKESKYEAAERLPEVQYVRNSTLDLTLEEVAPSCDKKKEEKRKSGMSFLTNISELDREATEIIRSKDQEKNGVSSNEIPEFMKPRDSKAGVQDSWSSPKRRSARDLIAKFNAITNVTKATVFGASQKEKYFGKQHSLDETRRQENLLGAHKKRIEEIGKKKDEKFNPLIKSESASAVKQTSGEADTPKSEKKSWKCPKCNLENEYWRIICQVCSAIKPYFDEFAPSTKCGVETKPLEPKTSSPVILRKEQAQNERVFERSKTQIGFSALASYNHGKKKLNQDDDKSKVDDTSKKEEREKLKRMLIEMKNSLPKRKSNILLKQSSRSSVILEKPEEVKDQGTEEEKENVVEQKTEEEKIAEILIGQTKTIYENIKVRKSDNPKPLKVSSAAQTSGVVKKTVPENSLKELLENHKSANVYEPMKVEDFEDIYSDKNGNSAARIYANLAQSDELSLFFNLPKISAQAKNDGKKQKSASKFNTDTIEINRRLRKLESAIAKGDMTDAAIFAKELAQLKVNCSVIRQKPQGQSGLDKKGFQIEMYVEDKVSHRGPFAVDVRENLTVAELKRQIFKEFEIPVEVQKWILGKELVTNDAGTLKDYNITAGCPVFLYLVAPENKSEEKAYTNAKPSVDSSNLPSTSSVSTPQAIPTSDAITANTNRTKLKTQDYDLKPERCSKGSPKKIDTPESGASNNAQVKIPFLNYVPKIVNVIPKSSEVIPNNADMEAAPSQSQARKLSLEETKRIVSKYLPTPSVSITEFKVDVVPVVTKQPRLEAQKVILDDAPGQSCSKTDLKVKETSKVESKIMLAHNEIAVNASELKVLNKHSDRKINQKRTSSIPPTEAPRAQAEEDFDDSNTLKAPKEWECHLCTLLNPISSNVCAVCATVRLSRTPLRSSAKKKAPQPEQTYQQLVNLDNADLVSNAEPFECVVCLIEVPEHDGVTLRECLHQFCRQCLAHTVEYTEDAEVKCPYRDNNYSCNIALQDREIKALVSSAMYEQYLAKSVAQAENMTDKSFHCKTPDCKGWCIFEDNVNDFKCPVCKRINCLTCQAIHTGMNCKQYQEKMKSESEIDEDAKRTKDMLEGMVEKGEALTCPTCKVILMKKWGCDWLRCSMCKTEICWVTRGPRWGPGGKGDTSGGCQCGVNGIKCHPQCNYCH
ncbi:uncharacterized protein LOC132696140 [Cylas formicarius]|uniref:uncharacterized protein LOC132696140 n=1 Tax=Cylas formicarius TaxID=197179 RepID=UPI0029589D37|nr:uncharacterized protein LOC132696140 [Cylas formicarius]XP_060516772.1 uncharacterized protein LOC132696140 [Cylas formicarius]